MLDTGEVLMFLCSILLTGGHTLRNRIRKSSTKLAQLWFRCKWLNIYNIKVLTITKVIDAFRWDYYKDGNKLYKAMNPMVAYERGLTTWAEWVEINLDPSKTKVIFRTSSPRSTSLSNLITLNTWKQSLIMYTQKNCIFGRESGQKCYNQRHPLPSSSEPHVPQQSRVLKKVLMKMKYRVYLHDITTMSAYRRDGHPSVFKRAMGEEEKHHRFAGPLPDCSHWCLPGVPDIWNEMLSSIILTKAAWVMCLSYSYGVVTCMSYDLVSVWKGKSVVYYI